MESGAVWGVLHQSPFPSSCCHQQGDTSSQELVDLPQWDTDTYPRTHTPADQTVVFGAGDPAQAEPLATQPQGPWDTEAELGRGKEGHGMGVGKMQVHGCPGVHTCAGCLHFRLGSGLHCPWDQGCWTPLRPPAPRPWLLRLSQNSRGLGTVGHLTSPQRSSV